MKYLKKFETFVNDTSWDDSLVGQAVNSITGSDRTTNGEDEEEENRDGEKNSSSTENSAPENAESEN